MKKNKTTWWAQVTDAAWKRVLIAIGALIAIPLIAYGIAEYNYQQRVNTLSSAIDKIWQDQIKPAGGIANSLGGLDSDCAHWFSGFPDAGPCPRVGRSWQVPVEPGKETSFITDLLSKEGYTVHVGSQSDYKPGYPLQGGGIKDGVGLNIEMIVDKSTQPQQAAPTGKQWLQLGISALESH